jgi:hypothetical protein
MVFHYFIGLAYQGQDIVFRCIIEYSNLRDLKVLTPDCSHFPKVLTLELVPTSKNKNYEQ